MLISELSQGQRKAQAGVENDQFFTRPEVAQQFASWVKGQPFFKTVSRIIEPAAGNRDLAKFFPGIEMFDLDPKSPDIKKQDFFTAQHKPEAGFLTVMNPPFGKGSDLAIRFFNKAVEFSDYIAMIVPRTFRRASVQNRLHQNFTLVDEYVLPRNSFYLPAEGPDRGYDVPAVAQIWKRTNQPRSVAKPSVTTPGVQYVADPAQADFAFRRKGRSAGQIVTQDFAAANPNSFFFVRGDVTPWTKIDWSQLGNDVMGARSIAKADIAQALSK